MSNESSSVKATEPKRAFELLGFPTMLCNQFVATKGDNIGQWIYSRPKTVPQFDFVKHLRGRRTYAVPAVVKISGGYKGIVVPCVRRRRALP